MGGEYETGGVLSKCINRSLRMRSRNKRLSQDRRPSIISARSGVSQEKTRTNTLASTTRKPTAPLTTKCGSTTPVEEFAGPIAAVPTG